MVAEEDGEDFVEYGKDLTDEDGEDFAEEDGEGFAKEDGRDFAEDVDDSNDEVSETSLEL